MAQYRTGTVSVTNGSAIVTGSGAAWLSDPNIGAGSRFVIDDENVSYPIATRDSDTQITLAAPYPGATDSGLEYVIHTSQSPTGLSYFDPDDSNTAPLVNEIVDRVDQNSDDFDSLNKARIDSVAMIPAVEPDYDGQVYTLTSWHPGWAATAGGPLGGGNLAYQAGKAKSEHNGVTVFSITVPYNNANDYRNGVGETDPGGLGCLVRTDNRLTYEIGGAKADGVTSDSDAMNAVNALQGTVEMDGRKTYYSAGLVNITAPLHINGNNALVKYANGDGRVQLNGANNVTIQGLRINANKSFWTSADFYTLGIYDSQKVWIDHCEVFNGMNTGIAVGQSANMLNEDIKITYNTIHDIGDPTTLPGFLGYGNGIAVTGGKRIWIEGNTVYDIYQVGGINLEGQLQDEIWVLNNRVYNLTGKASAIKLYAGGADVPSNEIIVQGNICSNWNLDNDPAADPGFWLNAAGQNVKCTDNTINCSLVISSGINLSFARNTVKGTNVFCTGLNSATFIDNDFTLTVDEDFYFETQAGGGGAKIIGNNRFKPVDDTTNVYVTINGGGAPLEFTGNTLVNMSAVGKGYGVTSSAGYGKTKTGGNTIIDTLPAANYGSRLFGYYNFSGSGVNELRYLRDRLDVDDETLWPEFDLTASTGSFYTTHPMRTSAPGGGYHEIGEIVWNAAATPSGWRCTVTGTPGTWTAFTL